MTWLRRAGVLLASHALTAAAVALAVLFLAGELRDGRRQAPAPPRVPTVLRESPAVSPRPGAPAPRLDVAVAVRPLALTPKQTAKLEAAGALPLHLADGAPSPLLAAVEVPASEAGGDVTLQAAPGGATQAVFVARPVPFFDVGGKWEVGAGVVAASGGYGPTLHVAKDLARVGRVYVRLEADADVLRGGVTGRGAVLGVARF